MKFRVVIEQDEDGKFIASCPTLPGCWSPGDTRVDARRNTTDAIKGYLKSMEKHGDPTPPPISEEIIDVDIERAA